MPKGYWVAQMDIHDAAAYDRYKAKNGKAFAEFGGRFVIRGGQQSLIEGACRARTVVIEFPSYQAAVDCYHSDSYKEAMAERAGASTGDLVIVEGNDA